jgi:hypothetical protein
MLYLKNQRMFSPNKLSSFPEEAKDICLSIINMKKRNIDSLASELKQVLQSFNIIKQSTTYNDICNDHVFMKTLLYYLSIGLSMEASPRGVGLFSDFDLFHKMSTDKKMNAMLTSVNLIDSVKIEKLNKSRRSIRYNMYRLRDKVVSAMRLPGDPKHERKPKTKQDIETEVMNAFGLLVNNKNVDSSISIS